MRRLFPLLSLIVTTQLAAQSASSARGLGFDPARLARIDTVLQRYVDSGQVAGMVLRIERDGRLAYERAFGWADREAGRRMTTDAIFRIASQSKAITSVAILALVEDGKIGLGEPVSRWLPGYATATVATRTDSGLSLVPARRAITIRDLLTHTAGISYGTDAVVAPLYEAKGLGPAAGYGWYTADKDEPVCETMDRLTTLPLVAQPGERFVYGYNTDILGCVVERASGMTLDAFIEARVTGPLGMRDTRFFAPPEQRARLVAVYGSTPDGRSERAAVGARGQGHYAEGPRRNFSGGAGLLSTARDYARFLEMIRNGGALDGVRILAPHTVRLMTTNQIPGRYTEGMGFGLGFETVERYGANGMRSQGSFGWGGAYGSLYWVDPEERLVVTFMMQLLPNRSDVRDRVGSLVYQALTGTARETPPRGASARGASARGVSASRTSPQ